MALTDTDKARDYLRGVAAGDPDIATRHVDPDAYVDHAQSGVNSALGLWKHVDGLPKASTEVNVVRLLRDGPFVVVQHQGGSQGRLAVFEVFRFEGGLIVEHWMFSSADGSPNKSGHTQADGPTEPRHLDKTEANKRVVRDYYDTVHLGGQHDQARQWFLGDLMIRHEAGVADGGEEFLRDLSVLIQDRTIDELKLFAGQGDMVFLVAKGTHQGEPCAYVDLYRVEDEKIVEHWGFPEAFPSVQ